MSAKTSFCALRSVKSGKDEVAYSSPSLLVVKMSTRVDGAETGRGLKSRESTSENIAVFTPTPSPMDSTATRVNPGLRRSHRNAYRMSCNIAPPPP